MAQYIDKAALVAEIERRKTNIKGYCCQEGHDARFDVVPEQLSYILAFLNTLEVKEMDLEKEFDNYTNGILACDIQFEPFTHLHNCAKYFFELGLKAQKGE